MSATETNIPKTTLKKRRTIRPRLVWLLVAVIFVLGVWNFSLQFAEDSSVFQIIDNAITWILLPVFFGSVAALVLEKHPGHLIGRLLMIFPFALITTPLLDQLLLSGISESTPLTTGQYLYAWFSSYSWWFLIAPVLFVIQLYPTGAAISPKWRRAAYLVFVTIAFDVLLFTFAPTFRLSDNATIVSNPLPTIPEVMLEAGEILFGVLLIASATISVASLAVRFRNSMDVERAQLKWLFYAVVLFLLFFTINLVTSILGEDIIFINLIFGISLLSIPLAIGIGILRYRLWDIDVVINRSLLYGALTTILAATFAAITNLGGQFAKSFAGEGANEVAAAVGAIMVASLFQPVRTTLEKTINKRFFSVYLDNSEGLGELNPDLWQYITLDDILNAALNHLQDIYKFDRAAIYLNSTNGTLSPRAAFGLPVNTLPAYKIGKDEQAHFLQKKGWPTTDPGDFIMSIPLYWSRRKAPQVLGVLRLGKRPGGRAYSSDELKALQTFGGKLGQPIFALERT